MLEQFYMDSYSNPGFTYIQRKHPHHFLFVAAVHAIAICAVLWGTTNSEAVYMFNQSGSLLVDNVAVLPTPKPQPPVTPKVKRDTVQKPEVEIERKSADSIELKATNETPAQQQDPTNSAQTVLSVLSIVANKTPDELSARLNQLGYQEFDSNTPLNALIGNDIKTQVRILKLLMSNDEVPRH